MWCQNLPTLFLEERRDRKYKPSSQAYKGIFHTQQTHFWASQHTRYMMKCITAFLETQVASTYAKLCIESTNSHNASIFQSPTSLRERHLQIIKDYEPSSGHIFEVCFGQEEHPILQALDLSDVIAAVYLERWITFQGWAKERGGMTLKLRCARLH